MKKRNKHPFLTEEQFLRTADDVMDYLVMLVLILIMLAGIHRSVDALYVFDQTSVPVKTAFYPEQETAEIDMVLSEDVAGWLELDDTPISYPVMQGKTNTEYLNRDCYGNYSVSGSIFLDYRNSRSFQDDYSLIYGHHMAHSYMFGALDDYYDEDYYMKHRQGTLTVSDKVYRLEVFALVECEADNRLVFALGNRDEVIDYLVQSAVRFRDPGRKRLLALSTCRDTDSLQRTVLFLTMEEADDEK